QGRDHEVGVAVAIEVVPRGRRNGGPGWSRRGRGWAGDGEGHGHGDGRSQRDAERTLHVDVSPPGHQTTAPRPGSEGPRAESRGEDIRSDPGRRQPFGGFVAAFATHFMALEAGRLVEAFPEGGQ